MPPAVILAIQGIQAAISLAPDIEQVITSAKNLISGLVTKGVISVDQQNALHAWCDNQAALAKAGIVPASWQVQP